MRAKFLIALLGALFVLSTPAHAQDTSKKVFKIGWAQDPQTLNPFVDYDEEDFRIWANQYDLLVNFDPKTMTITGDPEASKLMTRDYRKPFVVPENV